MTVLNRLLDTRPLHANARFRRLWIGTSLQMFGRQVASVALLYQVWELTKSTFWVGFIGVVYAIPTIVLGMLGGVLADRLDRRQLALVTTAGASIFAVLLAWQAFTELGSLAVVLVLLAAQVSFTSLGTPARRTFVPRLLAGDQLSAGLALTSLSFQISMLIGPVVAGLVIATWGLEACYALEAVAFCAAFYGVFGLPEMRPIRSQEQVQAPALRAIFSGFVYIVRRPLLSGSVASDLAATVLAMPIALFPAINAEHFAGNQEVLGLFFSAIAAGGCVAAGLSGSFTRVRRVGALQLGAAAVWGFALAGAGFSANLWTTLTMLAVAGAADTVAVVSRTTVLQFATRDDYRGRVSSVEQIVGVAGPELGNFRGGLIASVTSPAVALWSGGLLCVAAVLAIAALDPPLRKFDQSAARSR